MNYHTHGRLLIEISRDGQRGCRWRHSRKWAWRSIADEILPASGCGCDCARGCPPRPHEPRGVFRTLTARSRTPRARPCLPTSTRWPTNWQSKPCNAAATRPPETNCCKCGSKTRRNGACGSAWRWAKRRPISDPGAGSPTRAGVSLESPLPTLQAGVQAVEFRIAAAEGPAIQGQVKIRVPDFYRSDYGQQIAGVSGETAVWWCPATHKVPRVGRCPKTAATPCGSKRGGTTTKPLKSSFALRNRCAA